MNIGTLCNREVIVADRNASIIELANLMRKHHVGDIVIVERESGQTKPLGIVTDRDIVIEVIANEVPLGDCCAVDIMSYELATVNEAESVWETLELMRDRGVRRLPVVNKQGSLVGIVCVDDLQAHIAEQMQSMANLVNREQRRETRLRR